MAFSEEGNRPWGSDIVYQVYPRSFCDTTGNGEGDLSGISSRLRYLQLLGVDAIWLTPFYPSPQEDGGYDISDYTKVDLRYGTLDGFRNMVEEAHGRGIKVMTDLVFNHTSREHRWFQRSRQFDPAYEDFYVWSDTVPNNWASVFSLPQLERWRRGELRVADGEFIPPNPAWTYDEKRGQYYLHSFGPDQPDLNLANPQVRRMLKSVMRFWLNLGVDGFRFDAVPYYGKDPNFLDEGYDPTYVDGEHNPYDQLLRERSCNYMPALEPHLRELLRVFDEPQFASRSLYAVLEACYHSIDDIVQLAHIDPSRGGPFDMPSLHLPWNAQRRKQHTDRYMSMLGEKCIPTHVNGGNHDMSRLVSRLMAEGVSPRAARASAVLRLLLPGIVFVYQGEELGLEDGIVPPDKMQDPLGGRDPARTPMPWTSGKYAGFSSSEPWLPISESHRRQNAEDQLRDPMSMLSLYRAILRFRREHTRGMRYAPIDTDFAGVSGYALRRGREQFTVVANYTSWPQHTRIFSGQNAARTFLSSEASHCHANRPADLDSGITLAPNEAIVLSGF